MQFSKIFADILVKRNVRNYMRCHLKHLGSESFSVEGQSFKSVVRRISSYEAKTGTQTKPKTYFSDPLVVTQLGGGKKKDA